MDKAEIDAWARGFVADLKVSDEVVPLDRVLSRHLAAFSELRSQGLTWSSIASIIVRAGARRANGSPISPDQLRANVARLKKRTTSGTVGASLGPARATVQTVVIRPERKGAPTSRSKVSAIRAVHRPAEPATKPTDPDSKEISQDDIAAALSRIQAR